MGPYAGPSMGEIIVDNYEDSVLYFTEMTTGIFGHLFKDDDPITIEKVLTQTGNSESGPTVVGTPRLCVFWFACDRIECELLNAN